MIWFMIFLIAVIILCYVAKITQEKQDAKEGSSTELIPTIALSNSPDNSDNPSCSDNQISQIDNDELIAVISAAITAFSPSTTTKILSLRSGDKVFIWPAKFNQ